MSPWFMNLACTMALVPAALINLRQQPARDSPFWATQVLALLGAAIWVIVALRGAWPTGLGAALWLTIAVCLTLFAVLAAAEREAWRLTPLLMSYLLLLALAAAVWSGAGGRPLQSGLPSAWLEAHILLSLLTYAGLTMAAIAGSAILLQDRALKARRPTRLTRLLPSIAACERLEGRLLGLAEVVLALGILSGIGTRYVLDGRPLIIDHKTLLTLIAFVFIGGLLIARRVAGVRGRRGARFVLAAYLLLTLAFPGVKFVTDVLMAHG
ncbi:MAG: hypothetical protein EXQ96_07850 [Alphaproteobacteria bacterium]|nr:hypothetical protein [Alphaproteobacteria bacterium]